MDNILKQIREIDPRTITQKELEDLLPTLGMNGENPHELPSHLHEHFNKGIRFWQYPNQFSKYLLHVLQYDDIESYLEIGCRWGGTFIITSELLRKRHPDLKAYACDLMSISDILEWYSTQTDFRYLNQSSTTLNKYNVQAQIDLIFIDGDHSYEGLKNDFEMCKQFNPKYVVFHDITNDACPGVSAIWNEVKNLYTSYEFADQYDEVSGSYLGIGMIEIR